MTILVHCTMSMCKKSILLYYLRVYANVISMKFVVEINGEDVQKVSLFERNCTNLSLDANEIQ